MLNDITVFRILPESFPLERTAYVHINVNWSGWVLVQASSGSIVQLRG